MFGADPYGRGNPVRAGLQLHDDRARLPLPAQGRHAGQGLRQIGEAVLPARSGCSRGRDLQDHGRLRLAGPSRRGRAEDEHSGE
ncbi:hypothetical protein [Methylorubrum aminovorans]|uniref:hypothetical protein n=1 Tax=Methylorubrum aminovorans TaxID=269069 RepID=UPI001EDE0B5C|nr:hypothetical protein [Methylorubrum aminovorans]